MTKIPPEAAENADPKLLAVLAEIWSGPIGACEKATQCAWKSKACELAFNMGLHLPAKRYLLCYAWTKYQGKPIEV